MRLAIVVNPRSGNGRGGRLAADVAGYLRDAGVEHEVHLCRDATDSERLAREAADRGVAIVAALGGDGHVGAVANGLHGSESVLAVLPAGTANDFARNLGLPWKEPRLLTRLLHDDRAVIRRIDLGRVETEQGARLYLNVAGAGFDSVVTARGERVRGLGRHRYVYATLETLAWFKPVPFKVSVDGETHQITARFVAVGNGPAYGGGMKITPGATYHDGMLEVCVIGALTRLQIMRLFPTVFSGTHIGRHREVYLFRGCQVSVESQPIYEVFADGERVGSTPARFNCLPAALPVLVPGGLADHEPDAGERARP